MPRPKPATAALSILCLVAFFAGAGRAAADEEVVVGRFSDFRAGESLPEGWEPLTFPKIPRHTEYSLIEDGETVVVKAVADASASGLIRRLEIDPAEFPVIEWRWKVLRLLEKADVRTKAGDDYPARIYVTFVYDPDKLSFTERLGYQAARVLYGEYPPTGAINYIWESRTPVGTIVPNAYTDRTQMIVVESGAGNLGEWVTERRDIHEDYRAAFGAEPPKISGIAIMTDTDNTGESATAFYGDIVFRRRD